MSARSVGTCDVIKVLPQTYQIISYYRTNTLVRGCRCSGRSSFKQTHDVVTTSSGRRGDVEMSLLRRCVFYWDFICIYSEPSIFHFAGISTRMASFHGFISRAVPCENESEDTRKLNSSINLRICTIWAGPLLSTELQNVLSGMKYHDQT